MVFPLNVFIRLLLVRNGKKKQNCSALLLSFLLETVTVINNGFYRSFVLLTKYDANNFKTVDVHANEFDSKIKNQWNITPLTRIHMHMPTRLVYWLWSEKYEPICMQIARTHFMNFYIYLFTESAGMHAFITYHLCVGHWMEIIVQSSWMDFYSNVQWTMR